jgi:hypothetical protein
VAGDVNRDGRDDLTIIGAGISGIRNETAHPFETHESLFLAALLTDEDPNTRVVNDSGYDLVAYHVNGSVYALEPRIEPGESFTVPASQYNDDTVDLLLVMESPEGLTRTTTPMPHAYLDVPAGSVVHHTYTATDAMTWARGCEDGSFWHIDDEGYGRHGYRTIAFYPDGTLLWNRYDSTVVHSGTYSDDDTLTMFGSYHPWYGDLRTMRIDQGSTDTISGANLFEGLRGECEAALEAGTTLGQSELYIDLNGTTDNRFLFSHCL